jgi:hypothetical protein
MFKKIVFSLFLVSAISACGKKEDAGTDSNPSISETISAVGKVSKMADASKDLEKRMEELKKLSPLTNEQYKSVVPESFGGVARSNLEIQNTALTGLHMVSAKFDKDTQNFEVSLFDGVGEMGSGMVAMAEIASIGGSESESPTGYMKGLTLGSVKGTEKQDRSNPQNVDNEITLIVAKRFVVIFKSRKGADMDGLKLAIKESKVIDKLETLK